MTTDQTARRPGRPKGAKTERLPVIEYRPAVCPACGSTDRTAKRNQQRGPIQSEAPPLTHAENGRLYRTIWYTVDCRTCGQRYKLRERRDITEESDQ